MSSLEGSGRAAIRGTKLELRFTYLYRFPTRSSDVSSASVVLFPVITLRRGHASDLELPFVPQRDFFDGVNEARIENASVLIEGNLIKAVSTEAIEAAGATVIDGGGRNLIPGLIDAHVHMTITESIADLRDNYDWMYWGAVSTIEAEKMLLRGFTSVRDAGGPAIGLQKAID